MTSPRIRLVLDGLRHAYGDTPVLDGVSLRCAAGELVSLLGPSGSGKTTLMRAIAGLVTPSHGSIRIDDEVLTRDGVERIPTERRGVGIVFQDYALFPNLTVERNVRFGLPGGDGTEHAEHLMALTGLDALRDRLPHQLSGGQQQRAALARALAPRPRVLLLDEPFANLDAGLRAPLASELRAILRESGCATLLVTHDRDEALSLADRIGVLVPAAGGARLAQVDRPEVVYLRPASRAVAELTGPVSRLTARGNGEEATSEIGRIPIVAPLEGPLEVLARPSQLRWRDEDAGPAILETRLFLGSTERLVVRLPSGARLSIDRVSRDGGGPGARGRVEAIEPLWALPTPSTEA